MSIPFDLIGAPLALCLRLLLGGVFLFGGIVKLKDRRAFDGVLRALVRNEQQRIFIARSLPFLEAALGGLLLFNVAPVFMAGCILLLLLLFSASLLYGWRTKKLAECGCARTPLSPKAALLRNGLLLAVGGIVLWHPDPSFSSWSLLVEGMVTLFIALGAMRGGQSVPQRHHHLSAASGPSRRSLLRRGLALGAVLALPFLHPPTSLAFACTCECLGDEFYAWSSCICGIQELYLVEIMVCCYIGNICDVWLTPEAYVEC